jgi:L-arabinose isomerase
MTAPRSPKAGLLPFYLKLYDDLLPQCRAGFDGFLARIAAGLETRGLTVQTAPVCRVAGEFESALAQFAAAGVDCVVTLHLAYSPSLEAMAAFCKSKIPIVILDTSMDADFGMGVSPDRIMYNHGVHGVMDFASLLRRHGRAFEIVAGHDADPRVLARVAALAAGRAKEAVVSGKQRRTRTDSARTFRAARTGDLAPVFPASPAANAVATGALCGSRVLRVGESFAGMGDFAVAEDVLAARLGITVHQIGLDALDAAVRQVTDQEVAQEVAGDRNRFVCELPPEAHARSVRVGLGLRHILASGGYHGFSVNFQAFDRADRPANTMPFLEISKAMGRGVGYAGEGDVLTAALVGALARTFAVVTFTEIFCADWTGGNLFLSHMGEISPALAGDVPRVTARPFFSGGSLDPAILTCAVKPGPGVFVNLAPGPGDTFALILSPVEVLAENAALHPAMRDVVRCWVRPPVPVAEFLEAYSRAGGTHHSALVLGDRAEVIAAFGQRNGLEVVRICA